MGNTADLTVIAKDAFGNLISGAVVVLSATGTGNTITQPSSYTNIVGITSGSFQSSVAEVKYISASINGVWINQKAYILVHDWYETGILSNLDYRSITTNNLVIIAGTATRLYLSTDSGSSWTEPQPIGDVNSYWISTAINHNGSRILASNNTAYSNQGRIYLSNDSGSTWTETQPAGNVSSSWVSLAMNASGNIMMAVEKDASRAAATYRNTGSAWSSIPTLSGKNVTSVTMNDSGIIMLAGVVNEHLYRSLDTGSTWVTCSNVSLVDRKWSSVAMSGDGSRMLAGVNGGLAGRSRLFMSSDSGASWAETGPYAGADKYYCSIGISADGATILTVFWDAGGHVYISYNSGSTWVESFPRSGYITSSYWPVAINSEATILLVGEAGFPGGLFIRKR